MQSEFQKLNGQIFIGFNMNKTTYIILSAQIDNFWKKESFAVIPNIWMEFARVGMKLFLSFEDYYGENANKIVLVK